MWRACALALVFWLTGFGESRAQDVVLDSSELPIIVLELAHDGIPDEPKQLTRMRIIDDPGSRYNYVDGPTADYVGPVAIERRGATSQQLFPKIGYGLELRGEDGADSSATILGLPREEDWVLHGPYSDKSLIRNAFAYSLGGALLPYSPRGRYVELVSGGEYRGVYLLLEKIKRDKNRIDIAKLKVTDVAGDSLTGGYILKFDKGLGGVLGSDFQLPAVNLPRARPSNYVYHYPKQRDLQPKQVGYIQDWFAEFEQRLASPEFDDPTRGYLPLVDIETFVNFFLVNEVAKNVDGYRLSTYFYKDRDDRDGRLKMGPVWDFNLAFSNADYCGASPVQGWMAYFESYCPEDAYYAPFWWPRLLQSRHFRAALVRRYQALRSTGALSQMALDARIDSLLAELPAAAVSRNFEKWPVLGEYTWPNVYVPTNHADAVRYMRDWLHRRMDWMDGEISVLATDTSGVIPDAADFQLAPNPGRKPLRVAGLIAADYPIQVEWIAPDGRLVGQAEVASADDWADATPIQLGFYQVYVVTATGRELRTRWLKQ